MRRVVAAPALLAVLALLATGPPAPAQEPSLPTAPEPVPPTAPEPSAATAPLKVLITGDSMMYVRQGHGARRLRRTGADPVPDSAFGTGITKPWILDWRLHARSQMAERRPGLTLMFIGANDLFPLGGAPCCGDTWVARYAQRVAQIAATYGTVYWLTLPAPRDRGLARGFRAVNRALRRSGAVLRLVDLGPVFTPQGRYRRRMTWQGRRVVVRQMDGVHLSYDGSRIAADLLVRRLRADGLIAG